METNYTEHCRNLIVIDRQKIFLCFEQSYAAPLINVLCRRLRFSGGTAHVQRTERGKFSRGHIPARPGRIGGTASFSWLLNRLFEARRSPREWGSECSGEHTISAWRSIQDCGNSTSTEKARRRCCRQSATQAMSHSAALLNHHRNKMQSAPHAVQGGEKLIEDRT